MLQNQPPAPPLPPKMPEALTPQAPPQVSYQSNPFYLCFEKFSDFFEKNTWWAVAIIISGILSGLYNFFSNSMSNINDSPANRSETANTFSINQVDAFQGLEVNGIVVIAMIAFIFVIVTWVLQVFIGGLFQYVALKNHENHRVGFSEAFNAVLKRFPRLFFAQALAVLKIIAWSFLLIIPGIIAAYRYALLGYVILDEPDTKKGIIDSHNRIKTLIKGRKREAFGVSVVGGIIPIIGPLAGLVGNAALYRQLQIYHDNNYQKPSVHWLNYLGIILVGFFVLFIIGIVALATSLMSNFR